MIWLAIRLFLGKALERLLSTFDLARYMNVFPVFAGIYSRHGGSGNTKSRPYFAQRRSSFERNNLPDILIGQFRIAKFVCAMFDHIVIVIFGRPPIKVHGIHAPQMAIAARVASKVSFCWRFSMNGAAGLARRCLDATVYLYRDARHIFIKRERPDKAVISLMRDNDFIKEAYPFAHRGNISGQLSETDHSLVVHIAQAASQRNNRFAALTYRAYIVAIHNAVLSRFGQGRALFHQRFRPVLYSIFTAPSQRKAA